MNMIKTNKTQVASEVNGVASALFPLFRPVDGSAPKFNFAQKMGLMLFSVNGVFTTGLLSDAAWKMAYNVAEPQHAALSVIAGAMASIALWGSANATTALVDSFKSSKRA